MQSEMECGSSGVHQNSLKAWLLAMRPKTLTGAGIPVLTASSLAWADGTFRLSRALLCLLFAFLMQIAANLINDLFDYLKGTDGSDRLGPERACAQGWISPKAMKVGIGITLIVACSIGLTLLMWGQNPLLLVGLGLACVVFAFLYTTLLSYCGLGDVLVLVFFGFVPVLGTYYVQADCVTSDSVVLALACGLLIDTLLVLNNYRDRDTDRRCGKRTLIAIWGERFGRYLYLSLGCAAWLLCVIFFYEDRTWACVLSALYLPAHFRTWKNMIRIREGRALNGILGETSRNMILFAVLFSVGLLIV